MSTQMNIDSKKQAESNGVDVYFISNLTRKIIRELCKPNDNSIKKVKQYIKEYSRITDIILRSEIQSQIYKLTENEKEVFSENLEMLVESDNSLTKQEVKIIITIWDCSQEVISNIDNTRDKLIENAASARDDIDKELREEFKSIEKDYVAILGVLATIIVTFVSGIAFSTSVLENMHKVSIYKSLTIATIIGIVFITTIGIECSLIDNIINKKTNADKVNTSTKFVPTTKKEKIKAIVDSVADFICRNATQVLVIVVILILIWSISLVYPKIEDNEYKSENTYSEAYNNIVIQDSNHQINLMASHWLN